MAFTARNIMERAQIILNDAAATRWTLPELRYWLNDGLREVASVAPEALATTTYIKLKAGTLQDIPAWIAQIIRVNANVVGTSGTVNGRASLTAVTSRGRAVTPIKKMTLDAMEPSWQNPTVMPAQVNIVHFVEDSVVNKTFLVAPASVAPAGAGDGWLEVVAALIPNEIAAPGNPLDIASYTATVDLEDIYQNALLDFVLSKAFSKEIAVPAAAQRAQAHYAMFLQGLGIRDTKRTQHRPSSDMGPEPRPAG